MPGRNCAPFLTAFAVGLFILLILPPTSAADQQAYIYVATGQVTYVANTYSGVTLGDSAYFAFEFIPPAGVDPFTQHLYFSSGPSYCNHGEHACAVAVKSNLPYLQTFGDGYSISCESGGPCSYSIFYETGLATLCAPYFEWIYDYNTVEYSGITTAYKLSMAPEPSTMLTLGPGVLGLAAIWRRRDLKPSR